MTYLLVNAAFLLPALVLAVVAFAVARRRHPHATAASPVALLLGLVGVLVATAVFDNVIVGTGIVDYDPQRISGIRLGVAPIEDFAYAIAAAALLPSLWILLRRPRSASQEHDGGRS
ncbi:lycopene cyclase domain-containing protein [Naasia lichenicola]|uniref:Lycopene cyclase domain-containing protein n=1 Tax=Naasia lichenicola TaxID=2565933 RepID=A0A4S4FHL3_9MICO|nr:lycopene cyclase domain-containing protein [Naasia lichenicola]THG29508.1 lycopene cyclase domain-containing protein [Naasia lichenicola]